MLTTSSFAHCPCTLLFTTHVIKGREVKRRRFLSRPVVSQMAADAKPYLLQTLNPTLFVRWLRTRWQLQIGRRRPQSLGWTPADALLSPRYGHLAGAICFSGALCTHPLSLQVLSCNGTHGDRLSFACPGHSLVGHTTGPEKARLIHRVLCEAWRAGNRWKTLGASWRTSSRGRLPRMWRSA